VNLEKCGEESRAQSMRVIIHKQKAGVLCVQETKLVSLNASKSFSVSGSNDIIGLIEGLIEKVWVL